MRGIEPPLASGGHSSDVDRAWMTSPASAPTTVPLIRMNCRSRPTCSSTLRAVSGASHRLTVSLITVVTTYRDELATVISDTVNRWDAPDTARKVELQVGRDLQFIRI